MGRSSLDPARTLGRLGVTPGAPFASARWPPAWRRFAMNCAPGSSTPRSPSTSRRRSRRRHQRVAGHHDRGRSARRTDRERRAAGAGRRLHPDQAAELRRNRPARRRQGRDRTGAAASGLPARPRVIRPGATVAGSARHHVHGRIAASGTASPSSSCLRTADQRRRVRSPEGAQAGRVVRRKCGGIRACPSSGVSTRREGTTVSS